MMHSARGYANSPSAARKLAARWRLDEFEEEDELWKLIDMLRGCEVPDAELDDLILGLGTPVRGVASVVPPSSSNKMDARAAAATEASSALPTTKRKIMSYLEGKRGSDRSRSEDEKNPDENAEDTSSEADGYSHKDATPLNCSEEDGARQVEENHSDEDELMDEENDGEGDGVPASTRRKLLDKRRLEAFVQRQPGDFVAEGENKVRHFLRSPQSKVFTCPLVCQMQKKPTQVHLPSRRPAVRQVCHR